MLNWRSYSEAKEKDDLKLMIEELADLVCDLEREVLGEEFNPVGKREKKDLKKILKNVRKANGNV
jgi:hypothetical protein